MKRKMAWWVLNSQVGSSRKTERQITERIWK